MDKIVALCRRRGFIFGSSEIYGGIGGFWDYGPLGTELKRNVKDAWWNDMVRNPQPGPGGRTYDMVGVDCSIIMHPKVWEASGHVGGFSDPLVDCKECKSRFRGDQLVAYRITSNPPTLVRGRDKGVFEFEPIVRCFTGLTETEIEDEISKLFEKAAKKFLAKHQLSGHLDPVWTRIPFEANREQCNCPAPACGAVGTLTEPRDFNLMFESHTGAVRGDASKVYLRPETAQGIFVNFRNVLDTTRVKLPLGIAQIGKSFRNEINPRNYTFRSREFEQYEIEFFCHPSEAEMWYEFWRDLRHQWYVGLGLKSDSLRLRNHEGDELAHYAKSCADVEYDFPFGISELEGIANRTDFDLKAHIDKSGKDLTYFDPERKERYVPYVIEPSGGVDRSVLAFITEAYTVDENRASPEFMNFHPRLAPIKAAVFPLVAKDGLPEIAEPISEDIKRQYPCQYDAKQSIGKRYARMDEAGTPFCFTIDGQTKEDGTLTVRDRNDASQIRIDKTRCLEYLRDQLHI
jgi:glycyl-tRNA synthetase